MLDDISGQCWGIRWYEDGCMDFVDRWLEGPNSVKLASYCLDRLGSDAGRAQRRGVVGTFERYQAGEVLTEYNRVFRFKFFELCRRGQIRVVCNLF